MRAPLVAVLVAVPLLAGCLHGTVPTAGPKDALALVPVPAFPLEQDHDHANALDHAAEANMIHVAFNSGYGDGTTAAIPPKEGFSELFVRDGLAFLGRRGGDDGGFIIFNVQDPSRPVRLSVFQGYADYDMESTYDNRYVFYVSQYFPTQQTARVPPMGGGDVPRSIHVVDIRDPTKPTEASLFPAPTRGAHTVTYYRTDGGRELVAVSTYDFLPDPSLGLPAPDEGINPASQRVELFDFVRDPAPHLVPLSVFQKIEPTVPNEFFPHDVAIEKHPITHQLIMYVAYWNLGGYLVDITDPTDPKELSHLTDFSPSKLLNIHLVAPHEGLIDGRHVTIAEPEIGPADETGQYTLFDTTDPTHPVRLGYWTLPGGMKNTKGLQFSPHNFDAEGGRITLAHYHAGVWILDIHDRAHLDRPAALAFTQPNEPRKGYAGDAPNVWTALYDKGYVYASDMTSGLYVYRYTGDAPPGLATT